MHRFTELVSHADADTPAPSARVLLNYDQRRRARLRVRLTDGTEAGIFLPRGTVLREGDVLRSEAGVLVRVSAASEHVSVVRASDPHLLARAAYHLGNRHVPLQVERDRLVYPHDHVLDGMCRELGLDVSEVLQPFEPERGGYAGEHRHGPFAPERAPFLSGRHGHD